MVTPDAVWNIFFPPVGFMSKMDKKSLEHTLTPGSCLMEQVTGIEPALSAWEAEVLPLHHTCKMFIIIPDYGRKVKPFLGYAAGTGIF